jgi:FtsP/CotA-like multicopper oxidase with cupredoxin domain
MRTIFRVLLAIPLLAFVVTTAVAQRNNCPARPVPGNIVTDPLAVHSQNGVVAVDLKMRNGLDANQDMFYCYTYLDTEAPTLRVNPGDHIVVNLENGIQGVQAGAMTHVHGGTPSDPCFGTMTGASTNIHFHGLNVPPNCHEDEVLFTLINPGDPPFHYDLKIPANEPPGMYWYHPHAHGLTQKQVMGGASGAIIVEGMDQVKPEVAGLTERVMILRDQLLNVIGDPDASNLTLNFQPATYPASRAPVITMPPSDKQFWRVLNAAGQTFFTLQVLVNGQPQTLQVVALDGVPLKTDLFMKTILLPPAGRAEFIVQGPAAGEVGNLITLGVNTGPDGDPNPPRMIADIIPETSGDLKSSAKSASPHLVGPRRFSDLKTQRPKKQRKLYFSEDLSDPDNARFFLTVKGQTPKQFDPSDPPAIITRQGTVEDWILENRSGEIHAFHMHQIHFVLLERDGVPVADTTVQDTVSLPAWDGHKKNYPSMKVRMDFRYPESVGTFVYHCHILDHEDGGMMAKIQVDPAN